jgi:biopolymer transport protein ExbD
MSPAKRTKQLRAATRLSPEEDPEFQIAPMIDILLVLLVFFMTISTSEVLQVRQDIVLPVAKDAKAKNPDSQKDGQVVLNVLWNEINNTGSVDMDTKNYADPGLIKGPLEVNAKRSPNMRVLVRADRKVRYDFLRNLLKITAEAGVQNVTFSVTDKDSDAKPGAAPAPTP